jgi:hypothetical protein
MSAWVQPDANEWLCHCCDVTSFDVIRTFLYFAMLNSYWEIKAEFRRAALAELFIWATLLIEVMLLNCAVTA